MAKKPAVPARDDPAEAEGVAVVAATPIRCDGIDYPVGARIHGLSAAAAADLIAAGAATAAD